MPTAVVTGASRGIGSEFVVRLLDSGWKVYAGYRSDKHRLELIDNEINPQSAPCAQQKSAMDG